MLSSDGSTTISGKKQDANNDFLKLVAVDLSSLEFRFDNIFSRLTAIEQQLNTTRQGQTDQELPYATEQKEKALDMNSEEHVATPSADDDSIDNTTTVEAPMPSRKHTIYTDGVALAQELESFRASQLQLKMDYKVSSSTLQLEMAQLRSDLEQGMVANLRDFRQEMMTTSSTAIRSLEIEYEKLMQTINVTFSERQRAENKWRMVLEDTIAARIQDVWSGLHSTSQKLQEDMQNLQTETFAHEEASRDVNSLVESMKASSEQLDQDIKKQLAQQEKSMEQFHELCAQAALRLDEQDEKLTSQIAIIYQQLEKTGTQIQRHVQAHDVFVAATDKAFITLASNVTSCTSNLTAHESSLHTLNVVVQRHDESLAQTDKRIESMSVKITRLDDCVTLNEKKLMTTRDIIEENYQEWQQMAAVIQGNMNQAALERAVVKEMQKQLHAVNKLAHSTELALERTTAELPKLHALFTANASIIAKSQQRIRDITTMIEDDRKIADRLRNEFDKEVANTLANFTNAGERDAQAQEAIAKVAVTVEDVKCEMEARMEENGNLIYQLNAMVGNLTIMESTENIEDKIKSFALSCAQLGLKLEFFGRKASSRDGSCVMKDDVKANLALLLTKVIRFLGSSVSTDQNKYLLTAKHSQAVDLVTGQRIIETPPQHVLESFRTTKASAFAAKTRTIMDQLQPVVRTTRTSIDFRDAFERKVRFVLEFGLANLFPNTGKPKNPTNRRSGEFGTCIACDRPIDSDDPQNTLKNVEIPVKHRAPYDVLTSTLNAQTADSTAESQRATSSLSRPNSAALRNRIDTKTVVRGRSGTSTLRPKSGTDVVHVAPGAGEFVYRGGFRIPRATSNTMVHASSTEVVSDNGPLEVENSCLEKIALLGKHQVVEIPSTGSDLAASPRAASLKTKSLPRLDVSQLDTIPVEAAAHEFKQDSRQLDGHF